MRTWFIVLSALIAGMGCGKDTESAKTSAAPAQATPKPAQAAQVVKVEDLPVYEPAALIEAVKKSPADKTLVALWATWCAPCIAEMPALDEFAKAHADKGLRVLGVCVDDKVELGDKIQGVLEDRQVSYAQALLKPGSEGELMTLIGEEWDGMLPKTILFDADAKKALFVSEALTEAVLTTKVLPAVQK